MKSKSIRQAADGGSRSVLNCSEGKGFLGAQVPWMWDLGTEVFFPCRPGYHCAPILLFPLSPALPLFLYFSPDFLLLNAPLAFTCHKYF